MSTAISDKFGPEAFQAIMQQVFGTAVPHVQALGITVEHFSGEEVLMRLPYRDIFLADPDRRLLHGGVVTTLIDTACGLGVVAALDPPRSVATLDLRIDYLKPGVAERDLLCRARCYRITSRIAFARAEAFHPDEETSPIAAAMGSFMLSDLPGGGG